MISPLSSEIAAATSSLTPGGSSIAPSTRESREVPEDAGSDVSLTLPDAVHLKQGPLQPAPERAPAHRRAGPVYGLDQVGQAEVAPRSRVEDHPRTRIVRTEGHHLLRRGAAPRGGGGLGLS